ncbi:MAG TPA: DNA ligase D [Pirellulales bacterium]|nr:DNA ligase D [Pirellulales bacterium]
MGLTEYRRKRDFSVTSEPRGGNVKPHKGQSFVIQKHAASRLHYDFRLELDGVLKSWAVPKGPSLDPAAKRLAMHVEDHPLEYGGFEGIIPQGEYGGGTVMLWDHGTWEPVGDGRKGYQNGKLEFVLHGKKLSGRWHLVRRGGRGASDERSWFLFKARDEFASDGADITAEEPLSVTTGRDLDEIAEEADRVWGPKGEVKKSRRGKKAAKRAKRVKPRSVTAHARQTSAPRSRAEITRMLKGLKTKTTALPKTMKVQLATLAKKTPEGDQWLHEIKFDGYRMLCRIDGKDVSFISRNNHDWTGRFKALTGPASELPIDKAMLDGEVVVLQADGTTSFQALQNAFNTGDQSSLVYYAFDLLYLNGHDIRDAPVETRKALLRLIIPDGGPVRYSEHVIGQGAAFFAEASRMRLEGIVSKRLGRPYLAGRTPDWIKAKTSLREEFVIGGFTKPSGARKHFGALAIGYYGADQHLYYAGRVGTGFDKRTLAMLSGKFKPLIQDKSPFVNLSGSRGQARGVTWVKPSLVAQVEFSHWTKDRQLRHPTFQGLREDKPANEVVRDDPIAVPTIEAAKAAAPAKRRARPRHAAAAVARKAGGLVPAANEVAGVRLSHPDKVLYPEDGITKFEIARYYEQVASWMLPHAEKRLLAIVRCPNGRAKPCFFQKHPSEGVSDHFLRVEVDETEKSEEYIAVHNAKGLVALAQMGALEIHVWGSKIDRLEKPDRLVFDLDPDPQVAWPRVIIAAKEVRLLLEELGLTSFVKTTGGKGLHIVVPIERRTSWDDAKDFCHAVASFMTAAAPNRYVDNMRKAARKGKIFIDYLRNARNATSVAAYSTRARPGAAVSVPVPWEELDELRTPDHFNVRNVPARLAALKQDPWAAMLTTRQSITAAMLQKLKVR